jgi:uncharacterized protein YndB with AHSA1/START domain
MTTTRQDIKELTITRVFDAPRELVWKAWTEPERLMRWWGPRRFTSPFSKIDFRVGGVYLNDMRSPEGKDYWSTGVYREIVPLERIVATDSFADENGNVVPGTYYGMSGDLPLELLVTISFEEHEGKTTLTLSHAGFPPGEQWEGARQGWSESFDKLAESLRAAKGQTTLTKTRFVAEPGKQESIITRIFDAPRESVFKTYTDPNLIPQWWGPKNLTTTVEKMDARPGGVWRIVQRDAEGNEYAFHGVYHDVAPPQRLVRTFEFEGMPGHVSLETVTLEDLGGKTKLTTKSVFQTVEDRDGMFESGMEEGVNESMDRLAELLAKA